MKKILLLSFILFSHIAQAQVDDVSVVVYPTASYHFFDKKSTIGNGFMAGAQAGFSFGKFLELKGLYQRSIGIKQHFGEYENEIKTYYPEFDFDKRDLTVTHIGGEFKGNIPIGKFCPYLTIGTGVQTVKRESYFLDDNDIQSNLNKSEYEVQTLYGSRGMGIKINMGDRVTFNVEGKGYTYNLAPSSLLYDAGGPSDFTDWVKEQDKRRMVNWSLGAGLQLYLGGKNYENLSETDRAYLKRFGSGLKGFKLTLAPGIAFLSFDENTAYRNTYFLGGTLGFDISDYVGFRGFYYKAMDNGSALKFDKLSMYGGDFVGKLNGTRGIVPFITVGGGYINVADNYKGRSIDAPSGADTLLYQKAQSGYFAKGGIGLNIPLSKHVELFGAANVLYTINDNNTEIADLRSVSELNTHTMLNFGVRLKLGKSVKTNAPRNREKDNLISKEYHDMNGRSKEMDENRKDMDISKNEEAPVTPKKQEIKEQHTDERPKTSKVSLTPSELESMIDKVVKGVESEETDVQKRLNRLEYLLLQMNPGTSYPVNNAPENKNTNSEVTDKLLMEIKRLNQKIDQQNRKIEEIGGGK